MAMVSQTSAKTSGGDLPLNATFSGHGHFVKAKSIFIDLTRLNVEARILKECRQSFMVTFNTQQFLLHLLVVDFDHLMNSIFKIVQFCSSLSFCLPPSLACQQLWLKVIKYYIYFALAVQNRKAKMSCVLPSSIHLSIHSTDVPPKQPSDQSAEVLMKWLWPMRS